MVVPGQLASQPAWGPFVALVGRHAGPEAVSLLSTYWACGDLGQLRALVESAGLEVTATRTRLGTARFESVDAFVATEVEGTPLIDRISQAVYARIREEARDVLRPFTTPAGRVEAPLEGHLLAARRGQTLTSKQ